MPEGRGPGFGLAIAAVAVALTTPLWYDSALRLLGIIPTLQRAQLEDALPERPQVVLLDNFTLEDLRTAMAWAGALGTGRPLLEASGGVNLATVAAIADTAVDVVSVGALTHSARALDIGLDAADS